MKTANRVWHDSVSDLHDLRRRTRRGISLGLFVFLCTVGFAQTQRDRTGFELLEEGSPQSSRAQSVVGGIQKQVALESTIDPEQYFVGPSDVFAISVSVGSPSVYTLTVTPEGTLIIPNVGEVRVAEMTLASAKEKILDAIRKKFITGAVTATLIVPRPIIVTVTGNVLNPGLYQLTAVNRADRAVEEANQPNRLQTSEDLRKILNEGSVRNIVLRHSNGSQSRVDISKFLATKEDIWNPYLREGDVVVVPRKNFVKNVIGVYGEVNVPGRYEYVRGDSIRDAILIAQGFTRLALTDSIEFSRLSLDGTSMTMKVINGRSILDGTEADIELQPGDRIVVRASPDLREDYIATISGEVRYPGTYPITKNTTHLSELIRLAGGVTEFASLKSAELNRRSVAPEDVALERLLSARGGVSQEDSAYFYLETDLRIRKEIVNVDFEKLLLDRDSSQDIVLRSYDFVFVPSIKKTIYVFGQVVSPGHVPYEKGEDVSYYVQKAGGYTESARNSDIKIIKTRTKQWLSPDETTIEEGDYVWVPKEIERPFSYYMNIIGQTASIVSVGVSIILLVIQINK